MLIVTVLSFLLAYSCNNEKLNKASKNEMISFKVSTTSSSVPTHTTGTGSHLEVFETFQGSPGGQGGVVQVPVAIVTLPENTKYEVDVPAREYSVSTEVKVSGKEVTANSKMDITVNDKVYSVPVKTTVSKVDVKPVSRWKLEPSLFLGVGSSFSLNDLGRVDVAPMIAASFLSLGSTTGPSSLAIGAVGVGYGLARFSSFSTQHLSLHSIMTLTDFLIYETLIVAFVILISRQY
jgi:hypothetical protein